MIAGMETTKRAVVIGASMAGLLAARALADTYPTVTIIDRDTLPGRAENRRGVPQGKHLHGLLARGLTVLEELFPGFEEEMVAAGAVRADIQSEIHWYLDGHLLKPDPSGLTGISVSRPLLEFAVRQRVAALPGVEIIDNTDVLHLLTTGDRRRVTGVGIMSRVDGSAATTVEADLVVDASGRASRTPVWLRELGYEPAPEVKMTVDTTYVTRLYRREPHHFGGRPATSVGGYPGSPASGTMFAIEDNVFIFTTGGIFGKQVPMDDDGLLAFTKELPNRVYADFLPTATRLSEPVKTRYPASVRRYYEKLKEFPDRYLVVGDAICSYNPVYGQGMSVAALEAQVLRGLLDAGADDLPKRFFRAAAKPVDTAWTIATGADMRFPESEVTPPLVTRVLNRYLSRLYRVAADDATVATAFLRVLNLMDTPERLLAPAVLKRVLVAKRKTLSPREKQAAEAG
jgi:2-polyprenyl-6-methoxyphenol hydroxylase-like FAD-dependent oxidoreductase